MKVRELFKLDGISHSIGGSTIFLDKENCQVVNKTKNEENKNVVLLYLKRESDGEEGKVRLRVQDEFESISSKLLRWAFANNDMIGLTLSELEDLETNLNIESMQGRIQLK